MEKKMENDMETSIHALGWRVYLEDVLTWYVQLIGGGLLQASFGIVGRLTKSRDHPSMVRGLDILGSRVAMWGPQPLIIKT